MQIKFSAYISCARLTFLSQDIIVIIKGMTHFYKRLTNAVALTRTCVVKHKARMTKM